LDQSYRSTYGIKEDGSLWAWGYNSDGKLGIGTPDANESGVVTTPTRIGSDNDWKSVVVNVEGEFAYGVKTDGSLWAWGNNHQGQLGVGAGESSVLMSPKQVGNQKDWMIVTLTGNSAYGIKTDGTLWAWGYNGMRRLGLGQIPDDFVVEPKQIGQSNDWTFVDAWWPGDTTYALKQDGTLWAWGYDYDGALGIGSSGGWVAEPTQIASDVPWAAIELSASTYGYIYGLKRDGTLWKWGRARTGNTFSVYNVPVRVGFDQDWSSLAWHSKDLDGPDDNKDNLGYAYKGDGTLWQLGLLKNGGQSDGSVEPQKIESDIPWKR
jgi:alpha-tubulin suppressor-like RCC1 family protein